MKEKKYELSEDTFKICKHTLKVSLEEMRSELKQLIRMKDSNKQEIDECMETCRMVGHALEEMEKCK